MAKLSKHQSAVVQAVAKVIRRGEVATVYAVAKEVDRPREEEPHVFRDLEILVRHGHLRKEGSCYLVWDRWFGGVRRAPLIFISQG